jgi:hypothetical protein
VAKVNTSLLSFNRGEIGKHAIARLDAEQLKLASQVQVNWALLALGPMMFRPGTAHCTTTYSHQKARVLPFVFSTEDTALLEFTNLSLRPMIENKRYRPAPPRLSLQR